MADLHSLRKSLGTRLAREGVSPQVAQRIMRHSTIETTMRFYTDLGLVDAASAMARISAPTSIPTTRGTKRRNGAQEGAESGSQADTG